MTRTVFFYFLILITFSKNTISQSNSAMGNFAYEDCGCDVNIELSIYNGLNEGGSPGLYGGNLVANDEEESLGAVTIANLNDTDGDGTDDWEDDNGVTSSLTGRDELDLMRFEIDYTGIIPDGCDEKIILDPSGDIKFWKDHTKITEQLTLEFDLDELPVVLYVEAVSVSSSLKDIEVVSFLGDTEHDKVKATAIWCDPGIKYVTGISPDPIGLVNSGLVNYIYTRIDNNGDLYGLGYYQNSFLEGLYGGRILIEYNLQPSGAESLPLFFDMTRRLDESSGNMISGQSAFSNTSDDSFEVQVELGNDDEHNEDTDASPLIMHVYDAPGGFTSSNASQGQNTFSYKFWDGDFEEFVRMSFNPIQGINENGEEVIGSKCSENTSWEHARCLVLTSSDQIDPYDPSNQEYVVLPSTHTNSTPTRIQGSSTGNIEVQLFSGGTTEGYRLFFSNSNTCLLYNSSGTLIDSATLNSMNQWILTDSGKIKVTITNNNSFQAMDDFVFSVLNDSALFNNIKIE